MNTAVLRVAAERATRLGLRVWVTAHQRGGWPVLGAAVAAAAALALALAITPAWHADAERLSQQALRSQREARDLDLRAAAERSAAVDDGAAWPRADAAAARMADLLEAAVRNGVTVERLQQREAASGLTMPVRGSYIDLRRFLAEALHADPALALVRLSLRRTGPEVSDLDGEVQWVLVHRSAETTR